MGGDFNEIRYISERKGCSRREKGMTDFNGLIDQLSLVDLPMLERSFTWCNASNGERWSSIDRFLLNSGGLRNTHLSNGDCPEVYLIIAQYC
ncbi:hypothetical protein ACSBR1_029940 [Camellia fascicularis]